MSASEDDNMLKLRNIKEDENVCKCDDIMYTVRGMKQEGTLSDRNEKVNGEVMMINERVMKQGEILPGFTNINR